MPNRPMALPIVHYNSPVLRKKGAKISTFDPALRRLAQEMIETMHEAQGIGLAAQQVGQAIQLCVVDLREAKSDFTWEIDGARPPLDLFMPMVIVNPELTLLPSPKTSYEEGCLSFPDIRGDIDRPDTISVKFLDGEGTPHQLTCNGLFSRCIQHEVDHLNGVLFIDRMAKKVRAPLEKAIKQLAQETRDATKQPGEKEQT
ncbi:MAG: peptide deformylase [Nibricoccus sp.]